MTMRYRSSLTRLVWRRRPRAVGATVLLAAMALAAWFARPEPVTSVQLVHVIDGDSLTVRYGDADLTIRLTGIDAVEYRQSCTRAGMQWPCGREARQALERIVGRGSLHCALAAKDRYGRTLAACRTRISSDGIDLGAEMVRQGWAIASGADYLTEEAAAETARRGIWQGDFTAPPDWRAAHERPATVADVPDA